MAEMTGGELLMECLANQGASPVFAIPDGGYNCMFDWFLKKGKEKGVRFITPRHEAVAAHMADGYYRVTGRPATAVAGSGPGAGNLISGVISAAGEDIPMVVITTSRRSDLIAPLRGAMQTFDQVGSFGAVCKMSTQVTCLERLPAAVELVYKTAMSGIPGPVHIDIPEDIMNSKVDMTNLAPTPTLDPAVIQAESGAEEKAVAAAAKLLVDAKEPYIHCGATVVRTGAWKEVIALAEYLGISVTTTPGGRGAIPEDHPNSILPVCGLARASMSQADVILAVGCKFGEHDFYGKFPLYGAPGSQKLIHIHRVPERIGINMPAEVALIGHAPIVLTQVLNKVKELTQKREPHVKLKAYKDLQAMWETDLNDTHCKEGALLNTGMVIKAARKFFDRDTIMVMDGGNTTLWNSNFNRILEPRTMLWTSDFGQLGTGIPFALGAKVAAPEKNVCLITGDGAVGFNIMEMETARRNNLPFVCIVAADYHWGMCVSAQKRVYGYEGECVNCNHHEVRYNVVAEGMDCFGAYVDQLDQLEPALKAAIESGKPALIHVAVDADANTKPPGYDLYVQSHSAR